MCTKHKEKWKCPYCDKSYTDKNSHLISKVRQKDLQNKSFQLFLNKHDSITFISKEVKKEYFILELKMFFYLLSKYGIRSGPFLKMFLWYRYGGEVTIKFALNHKKLVNYNKERIIINKLSDLKLFLNYIILIMNIKKIILE